MEGVVEVMVSVDRYLGKEYIAKGSFNDVLS
jgi:hypothetical protein